MRPKLQDRFEELHGLRGFLACVVVFHHLKLGFLYGWFDSLEKSANNFVHYFAWPLARLLSNGTFAVYVFFVLSGFVLTHAMRHNLTLKQKCLAILGRYVRLAVPCVVSLLIVWVLIKLGLYIPQPIFDITPPAFNEWLGYHIHYQVPHFLDVFKIIFYDTFFMRFITPALCTYPKLMCDGMWLNSVLWTMPFEFVGSIAVFLLAWLKPKKHSWLMLLPTLLLIFFGYKNQAYWLPAILWGKVLYDLPDIKNYMAHSLLQKILWALTVGLLACVAYVDITNQSAAYYVVLSIGLVFVVRYLTGLKKHLVSPLAKWLGDISFSLYLVHMPILFSAGAFAWLNVGQSAWVVTLVTFAASFGLAQLFMILVDKPTQKLTSAWRKF
jgi:peptidoglycan/LPS O-acetylase OafA/YrhL